MLYSHSRMERVNMRGIVLSPDPRFTPDTPLWSKSSINQSGEPSTRSAAMPTHTRDGERICAIKCLTQTDDALHNSTLSNAGPTYQKE